MKNGAGVILRKVFVNAHARIFANGGHGLFKNARNPRVSVSRKNILIGEYDLLQLGSLLETGHLRRDDLCRDPKTNELVPLRKFLYRVKIPGFSGKRTANAPDEGLLQGMNLRPENLSRRRKRRRRARTRWMIPLVALVVAAGAALWAIKMSDEVMGLEKSLALGQAENSELKQKFQNVLFAAREVAASDQARGRVILRDASQKRIVLPGIKVRLYHRAEIEAHLSARYAKISEAGGSDPFRLSLHFLKNIPSPVETVTTNSDGRFEFKIPEPGEYVIQTSIRSGKSGEMRLWFVAFDSRDPLNTAVDITESNVVHQFNPLLMLVEGR